jgi:tetratricopeptide (TPR) repeat protein
MALWKLGRQKEALADSNTAINLIPDGIERAAAFLNRGSILRELGQEQQATEDLEQAKKLFKKFPQKGKNNTLSVLT